MNGRNRITKSDIITVPNILSLVRLIMIPFIVWSYCVWHNSDLTAVLLILSGITDVVDGFIARRFDMISEVGKALDPVADKCTQLATLLCLFTKYKRMMIPFVMLLIKELINGTVNLISARKNKKVEGAHWHGKVTTVLLYAMLVLHMLWINIPPHISNISIGICVIMMLVSFVLYLLRGVKNIIKAKTNNEEKNLAK